MEPLRDCETCKHYVQAHLSPTCIECLQFIGHDNVFLPKWEAKEEQMEDDVKTCHNCAHELVGLVRPDGTKTVCNHCLTSRSRGCGAAYWTPRESVEEPAEFDAVSKPKHYMIFPDLQALDVIRRTLSHEEFKGYLKGNILKYRLRAGRKGGDEKALEDIRKSEQYSEFLENEVQQWG